ncbi:MAG: alpha/beta hydrolase, partial [Rectinema sp.]|nr:alpha/beta hydrolase [Rectinema sp.]
TVRGRTWKGSFYLQRLPSPTPAWERSVEIPVEGGSLPASLVLPAGITALDGAAGGELPFVSLVILVAGAGKTDRNGNNPDVPGKTDTLMQLAEMLRERGVATLRFDRRGTGEAYRMEAPGSSIRFDLHVKDLIAVIQSALSLPREGRLILAGMNEGAWMAAAALNRARELSARIDGLVALDASGLSPMKALEASLSDADESLKAEALRIAAYLVEHNEFPPIPEELSDFFVPSRKEWLASWLALDPVREFRMLKLPVLFVRGKEDLQVSPEAFGLLRAARPNSAAKVIPDMNYVLKEVHGEEENYAAFTNPAFPIPTALADLIAAFAKAQPAPAGALDWDVREQR